MNQATFEKYRHPNNTTAQNRYIRMGTMVKRLAVLMATYNGEKYIKEQIESILNQDIHLDLTLIIRDDGSTDSTKNIIREYSDAGKLIFIEGQNKGAARGFISLPSR